MTPARMIFAIGVALFMTSAQASASQPSPDTLKAQLVTNCAFNVDHLHFAADGSVRLIAADDTTWRSLSCTIWHLQKARVRMTVLKPDGSPLFADQPPARR